MKQWGKRSRHRSSTLPLSEIVFIAVWYKCSSINNFKAFYGLIQQYHTNLFNHLPSYQCIVYLINTHQLALHALHHALTKGQRSGPSWIDQPYYCRSVKTRGSTAIKPYQQLRRVVKVQWAGF